MSKYLVPMVIGLVLLNMGSTLVQAESISRGTAEVQGDEYRCSSKLDCKYSDEECVFVDGDGASEGHAGYCVRHGDDIQFETNGSDVEYKHGDHCIDGRAF